MQPDGTSRKRAQRFANILQPNAFIDFQSFQRAAWDHALHFGSATPRHDGSVGRDADGTLNTESM